jgi:hypothetical protein
VTIVIFALKTHKIKISSSKTLPTTGVGKDVGKKEPLYTADGSAS